ncbi:Ribonuclease H-like domain containing protein [Trema orientale]|uniref:Ribonuclease H-like domain containing protein n=1 Tax=Trema orientale TaxID=63057 RepID=A0A2P5F1B4_TREOI|nr:Ribonuclease H-like domain containing protein [Trema orientale]
MPYFLKAVESWLSEYKNSTPIQVPSPSPMSIYSHWSPPPQFGELKLNVDAAVDKVHGTIGLGLIIRDHLGHVRGATAIRTLGHFTHHIAECMAICEGTKFALRHNLAMSELENDAKNVISIIHSIAPLSVNGPLISDIISNLCMLGNVICKFVPRDRNKIAHILASFALNSPISSVWLEETPQCIAHDVMLEVSSVF